MPTARAPRVNTHGWGIRFSFLGRTVAEGCSRDDAPVTVGEAPACTFVLPGLGPRARLTEGPALLLPAGLEGEVHRGGEVVSAADLRPSGRVDLAPGEFAELRVAAHPEVALRVERVELVRLPWSARLHGRDLVRQLVTGAGLVAMLAMLWRVESVENVLKLRGDPQALEDSPLFRAMFYEQLPEPPQPHRLSFAPPVLPSPPPPAPEPGPDLVDVAPPAAVPAVKDLEFEAMPEGEKPAPARDTLRKGKTRRSQRADGEEYLDSGVFAVLSASDSAEFGAVLGALEGGVVGGIEGGVPGGVEGGVVGGVVGGVEGGVLDEVVRPSVPAPQDMPLPSSVEVTPAAGGPHSHGEPGALATRGERDGVAAAVVASSCADPTVSRKQQIDIVFAVDVSTTMNFMLGKIEKEIAAVDATVRAEGLDARYGLVVFVDDVKVANAGKPYESLEALQRDLASWQSFTAGNRQILSGEANLDWPENSLDALHAAAAEFAWRPASTTLRTIVHATDDDFGEAPAVQSGQAVRHTYRQTVAALRAAEIRVFSFAAKIGGQCECLDVKAGLFGPYFGQKAIPAATGGAVFDIDEVASGSLSFGGALSGALQTAVCSHYPLWPLAGGAGKK